MNIILCCAGGFSTTMLMNSIQDTIKKSAKLNIDNFQFKAIPVDQLPNEIDTCDAIIVGPQIAHKVDYIKSVIDNRPIAYVVVDKETYGAMDGATVFKQVLIAKRKLEMGK
ncbi:PTS sugar transporter subunit IIB [Enterococcus camelliae]|uniref:PTS sugar transporter subunit IIB n=1 Tax=Enterococcus camelliae TaxID=453959 RepID=A0ABW5TKG1_9ENTE